MKITKKELPKEVVRLSNELSDLRRLINQKESNPYTEEEKLLNVRECADLINVSIPTLYVYTRTNKIPYNKTGKRLLFLKSEIIEWVKTGSNQKGGEK